MSVITGKDKPFRGLRNSTGAASMLGAVDFTDSDKFTLYEKGHSILKVLSVPNFMTSWVIQKSGNGDKDNKDKTEDKYDWRRDEQDLTAAEFQQRLDLCENFYKILECEFKGLDGLDDMTSETMSITDGFSQLDVIGKVNYATNKEITMRYTEKGGSTLSRYCETYLKGIRDPRTGVKHYNGALRIKQGDGDKTTAEPSDFGTGIFDPSTLTIKEFNPMYNYCTPSFANEVFSFLYIVTDNTWLQVERAYLLSNAQITKAPLGVLSNSEKGNIELAEIDLTFNCFVVSNDNVNAAAYKYLQKIRTNTNNPIVLNSTNMKYSAQKILTDKTDSYTDDAMEQPSLAHKLYKKTENGNVKQKWFIPGTQEDGYSEVVTE